MAPTSEAYAKKEARGAMPWNKLAPMDQRRVRYVVSNASVFRRLPTRVERCDPEVFSFLVRRPEVVTGIWNLMGVSDLSLERKSDGVLRAEDHHGGSGNLEVLYSDHDADARGVTVAAIDGLYHQKPMPRPINAKCVLLLRSGSTVESNGQTYVTARVDAFVKFERVAADLVARGLQPILVQTADHNFVETMKFVSTFSRTAETNPHGMRRLADKLVDIDEPARREMIDLCAAASRRAESLTAARVAEQNRLAQMRVDNASVK
ncbi:MAG: hypothetical protein AAGG46_06345 [Planctomycetota bacterium]